MNKKFFYLVPVFFFLAVLPIIYLRIKSSSSNLIPLAIYEQTPASPYEETYKPWQEQANDPDIIYKDLFENSLDTSTVSGWQVINSSPQNTAKLSVLRTADTTSNTSLELSVTSGSITLIHNMAAQQGKVEVYFYDDYPNTEGCYVAIANDSYPDDRLNTKMIAVGVYPATFSDTYWSRVGANESTKNINTHITRTQGWHKVELIASPKGSYATLDGINLTYLPILSSEGILVNPLLTSMTQFSKVVLVSAFGAHKSYFDNLRVTSLPALPPIGDRELVYADLLLAQPAGYNNTTAQPERAKADTALALALKGKSADAIGLLIQLADPASYSIWGYANHSLSPLDGYPFGLTSWIVWNAPNMTSDLRNTIKSILISEADHYAGINPESGYLNADTKAESNAWTAGYLALVSQMFPNETSSVKWGKMGRLWAYHTLTNSPDTYPISTSDPRLPGISPVTTQTLYSDYTLDNHYYTDPETGEKTALHENQNYVLDSIEGLAKGAIAYKLTKNSVPVEFTHNVIPVWNTLNGLDPKTGLTIGTSYVDLSTYLYINNLTSQVFGNKDEYGGDATNINIGSTYARQLLGQNDEIEKMTAFEFYTESNNNFPYKTYPITVNQAVYGFTRTDYSTQYLDNAVSAKRHLLSYLLLSDLTLPQISSDSTPTPSLVPTPSPTPTPSSSANPKCIADLNKDGIVNLGDLSSVLTAWGVYDRLTGVKPQDFNGDGVVNLSDLVIVLNGWGTVCH